MIDHISVAVRDLVIAERFYTAVLAPLGLSKVREFPRCRHRLRQEVSRVLDQQARGDGEWPRIAVCTSACAHPTLHRWMPFTRPRSKPAGQAADTARETASSFEKALRQTIETQPYTSAFVALGIGWLLGRMHRPL